MAISDITPSSYLFSYFHIEFYNFKEQQWRYAAKFHSSSLKYGQMIFFAKLIEEYIHKEFIQVEDLQITENHRIETSAFLEAIILNSRSSIDLAINGFLSLIDKDNAVDSFNRFLNKIKANKKYKELPLRDEFEKILNELDSNKFSWLRTVISNNGHRSLRDKITHKQNIKIDFSSINEDDLDISMLTGEFVIKNNKKIPISKNILEFVENIIKGTEEILVLIREKSYEIHFKRE